MAFTEQQCQALKAKLRYRHVKTKASNGATIAYVEGWHVIAEANRIFGYDAWDRATLSPHCIWSEVLRGQLICCYTTKVRITVRAGGTVTVREGIGTGIGRSSSPELAHEMGLKAAETDATKRALATFGNPFGLALYDKDQSQVTRRSKRQLLSKPSAPSSDPRSQDLVLRSADGHEHRFSDADDFVEAVRSAIAAVSTLDALYAFWEANLTSLRALRRLTKDQPDEPVAGIVFALKNKARELGQSSEIRPGEKSGAGVATRTPNPALRLAFPKERRLRDKAHLEFVASQPCLVCGRRPSHAHHLRFAQPRAMGLKVSDEFTVPLCNSHHNSVHKTGDERAWWARHGVLEPLKVADKLWAASHALETQTSQSGSGNDSSAISEGEGPSAAT